jgi:hypothetical protein
MGWLSQLFSRKQEEPAEADDPLVPVYVISLRAALGLSENMKGEPLTEEEVLKVRDEAPCIVLPLSKKRLMDQSRGYEDIDPDNCWEEWQRFRAAEGVSAD